MLAHRAAECATAQAGYAFLRCSDTAVAAELEYTGRQARNGRTIPTKVRLAARPTGLCSSLACDGLGLQGEHPTQAVKLSPQSAAALHAHR